VHPQSKALHRHRVIASFTTAWTLGLVALFIGYDAARRGNHHGWIAGAVAGTVFLLVGLLSYLVLFPWLSTRQARRSASKMLNDEYAPDTAYHSYGGGSYDLDTGAAKGERLPLLNLKDFGSYTRNPTYTGTSYEDGAAPYERPSYHSLETSSAAAPATAIEKEFDTLVAITACFMSYTHGANGISNAAGPLLAIWDTFTKGKVDHEVATSHWVSIVGLFGVCVGLAVWGSHVVRTVGKKLTKGITAPKAFSMNFGAASAVLVASYLKLPVSNTHCMIGAVVAVGRCDGGGDVEWMLVFKIFASWILTVPFSASIAAAIYSILKPLVAGVAIGSDALLMGCIGAACPGLINETNGTNTTPLPW